MKIVHLSDTHTYHKNIQIEECDILIHSGDITSKGEWWSTIDFLQWLDAQPARHKVFVAGNHDFNFDSKWKATTEFGKQRHTHIVPTEELIKEKLSAFPNLIYLNDSEIEIEGINIWGSPIQPWFHDWAFNRARGEEIKRHWDMIPLYTNILITHGPPFGIGDLTTTGYRTGCEDLLNKILKLQYLKLHCFGHIHEGQGIVEKYNSRFPDERIIFSNGSVLNEHYKAKHRPNVIEI